MSQELPLGKYEFQFYEREKLNDERSIEELLGYLKTKLNEKKVRRRLRLVRPRRRRRG